MFVTRNVFRKYMNPAGEGESGSGGGGGSGEGSGSAEGSNAGGGAGDGGSSGDGGTKPTDAEAKLLKEVMDKKNKLKAAEERVAAVESKLKEFEGIDPVAVKAMLKQQKDAETAQLEAKGEWDRLKAQMVEEFGREKAGILAQLSEKEATIAKQKATIAELTVGTSFSQSQFIANELVLTPAKTRAVYGAHFDVVDGKVIAYDKPAGSAERTPLVDAKGDALSFDEALKKIVEADPEREQVIKSKMRQGAGSGTAPKAGAPGSQGNVKLTGADRIAAALNSGALAKK